MELSDEDVTTFIEAWQKAFDETLSRDMALAEARRLIDFALTLAEARLDLAGLEKRPHGKVAA